MQSNHVNTDTEGAIESVHINGVPVLSGRVVRKISSCRVNTTNGREIKQVRLSFGSIFLPFSYESGRGHVLSSRGKSPVPAS